MSRTEMATFEATYPRYPFAPLVSLAIALAVWIRDWRRSDTAHRSHDDAVGEAA